MCKVISLKIMLNDGEKNIMNIGFHLASLCSANMHCSYKIPLLFTLLSKPCFRIKKNHFSTHFTVTVSSSSQAASNYKLALLVN